MLRMLPAPDDKEPRGALLRLVPNPTATTMGAARAKGLVYTLLRHGRGLAHAECLRRMAAPSPQDDGPFQAA